MRFETVIVLILFSFYAQRFFTKRKEAERS